MLGYLCLLSPVLSSSDWTSSKSVWMIKGQEKLSAVIWSISSLSTLLTEEAQLFLHSLIPFKLFLSSSSSKYLVWVVWNNSASSCTFLTNAEDLLQLIQARRFCSGTAPLPLSPDYRMTKSLWVLTAVSLPLPAYLFLTQSHTQSKMSPHPNNFCRFKLSNESNRESEKKCLNNSTVYTNNGLFYYIVFNPH